MPAVKAMRSYHFKIDDATIDRVKKAQTTLDLETEAQALRMIIRRGLDAVEGAAVEG